MRIYKKYGTLMPGYSIGAAADACVERGVYRRRSRKILRPFPYYIRLTTVRYVCRVMPCSGSRGSSLKIKWLGTAIIRFHSRSGE